MFFLDTALLDRHGKRRSVTYASSEEYKKRVLRLATLSMAGYGASWAIPPRFMLGRNALRNLGCQWDQKPVSNSFFGTGPGPAKRNSHEVSR